MARLATQLQDEANARIDAIQIESTDKERRHAEASSAFQKEIEALREQLRLVEAEAHQEATAHDKMRQALHSETVTRHTAEQQVADLKERVAENEAHRLSLEEKHKHAREALEHYRQSVKEQRDQDLRRHEQQVQQLQAEQRQLQQSLIVKQDEVTRLNQEGARLVADLSHAQKALYEQQTQGRQLEQKIATLKAVEQRATVLETQLADNKAQTQSIQNQFNTANAKAEGMSSQIHDLELALVQSQAKLEAQQGIAAELRAYWDARERPATEHAR